MSQMSQRKEAFTASSGKVSVIIMNIGMGGPPPAYKFEKVPTPKSIKDVPKYLFEVCGGFFYRFSYILRLVWKTGPWILFLMSFIALFQGLTPALGALISKSIINELQVVFVSSETDIKFISSGAFFLIISFFIYRFAKQMIGTLSTAINRIAGEKVVRQVKLQIMEKSKEIDMASYDLPSFYEKLENANREAGIRPLSILSQTFSVISTFIELISYVVILATAPDIWWAVLIIIIVSVPSAIINFIYRRKNFQYMRRRSKDRRQMNYYSDILVNKDTVKEVRMFGLADNFIDRYKNVFGTYYNGMRKLIVRESVWHVILGIAASVANLLFYLIIAKMVFERKIMIGDYTLYTGAIASIATCINTLISSSAGIYEGTLFIDNLICFMNEKQTVAPSLAEPRHVSRNSSHTIEFKNVSFRYPGTDRDILKNINLKFRPGETVVLVGLNGAGKTTLIKLLTRLYDPTEGYILLDGRDIREYDVKELYSLFGIIFQDFGKYAVSVGDNIRFGNIHRPDNADNIKRAAAQSDASDYIERLPKGYDTPLMRIFEPDGTELSIGQWQKLAIARAFYSDSDILILDEPTASLDPMAEQEIFNQFDRLRTDKTTIFVSHRLSSATVASLIVVLEYGCVVETGTHRELMDKKGKYFELFSTQARRYIENEHTPDQHTD